MNGLPFIIFTISFSSSTVLLLGGRGQVLQEGQTGGVDIHGNGDGIGGLHQRHLLTDQPRYSKA